MDINTFRTKYLADQASLAGISGVAADVASVCGRIPINSAGEAIMDVMFPVKFTSQPNFTYGFALQEGEGVISGRMPGGTATVQKWTTVQRLPNTVFYTGARIIAVTTGLKYQKMILNFDFSGVALSDPS